MHPRTANLVGNRYGRLIVTAIGGKDAQQKNRLWICLCDCGKVTEVRGDVLKGGTCNSCGCLAREVCTKAMVAARTTHGMTRTPTHRTWQAMMARCTNPNSTKFPQYGARGIKVCERWTTFENFLADMGERPAGHTIDRFPDRDGNYEPNNCRWATPAEQQRNRDNGLHLITHDGRTQCITDWANETGIPREVIYIRINRNGWPINLALTSPPRTRLSTALKSLLRPPTS